MHVPDSDLADRTQRQYQWAYAALLRDAARSGEPFNVILEARSSRATFEFAKCSTRHCETRALAELLFRLNALDETEIDGTAVLLDQMRISLDRLDLLDQADEAKLQVEPKTRTRATRLKLHPANWQQDLIEGTPRTLKIALLVLHLTGCRPCEIERGIRFQIGHSGTDVRLRLDIVGAKCNDSRGQPLRTFEFLSEDVRPMLSELITNLTSYAGQLPQVFRLGDVSRRVSRRARKLWPSHRAHPTAYSFRYAFRKHMTTVGATRVQIARAMGHQSMTSALCYGRQVGRERTLELTMEISAPIEPRRQSRTMTQGIGRERHPALAL